MDDDTLYDSPTTDSSAEPSGVGSDADGNPVASSTSVIQQPDNSPDVAPPPTGIQPDSSGLSMLTGQPSGAAATPEQQRVSPWQAILTGALRGLAGSAGAKNFAQGLAGGAGAEVAGIQQDKQNAIAQNESQARIKFQNAQAASLTAETALNDKRLHSFDQQQQDAHTANALDQLEKMKAMGLTPTLVADNHSTGAMTALQQLTDSHGAVPPMFTINLGDKIVGFNLNQLSQTPQALTQVNQIRALQGQQPFDAQTWAQLPAEARNTQTNSAFSFWNPLPSEQSLQVYKNYLNTAQAAPDSPDKAGNVQKLQGVVTSMQTALDNENKRANAQDAAKTAATEGAKVAAENSPSAIAGAARKAGAVASAEAKAKAQFDDASVVAFDPNAANADGSKGANVVMTRGQALQNGLQHYKVDASAINSVVGGMNDVQNKLNDLASVAADPNKMAQVQGPLASAMLSHKGLEIGAFGTHFDTSRVNEALYQENLQSANQATRDFVTATLAAHEAVSQLPRLQTFGKSNRMTQQQMEAAQAMLPRPGDDPAMAAQKMSSLQTTIDPLRKQIPRMPGAQMLPSWLEEKNAQQKSAGATPQAAQAQPAPAAQPTPSGTYNPSTGQVQWNPL